MKKQVAIGMTVVGAMGGMSGALAQTAPAADSDTQLQEIVVTAERREQNLQQTPLAVSVVSGDSIAKTGLSTFNDVLEQVPSVQMQYNPQPGNGPTIAIRGIGTDGPNKQSGTALYEDGISSYRLDDYFYDLARVEVLRGPQGTLYGGTATGGAVNVISNNPGPKYEGAAQLEYGNYDLWHAQGMINLPATDTLSFRLAGNWLRQDQFAGSTGPAGTDALNMRGKALWTPNDSLSLLAGVEYFRDNGLNRDAELYNANGSLSGTRIDQTGHNHAEVKKYFLNLNADLGIAKVTYIPALQYASLDQTYSTAATPPVSNNSMPDGRVMTQELRFSNEPGSKITWVAGGYYYAERSITTTTIFLGPPGQINVIDNVDLHQAAGFGQVTLPLSDTWRLTGGGRFSEDGVNHPQTSIYPPALGIPSGTVPFDKTFHRLDYLARVEHDVTAQNLVYGSISTGYRPGNVSVAGGAYTNETVTAYEVGSKNTLLNGSLTLNGAAFYYRYSGFQLANNVSCGPGCLLFDIVSVPADFTGVELDAAYRPTPSDTIRLEPSYLQAHFTGNADVTAVLGQPAVPLALDGKTVPHAAKWRLDGNYQHDFRLLNGSSLFGRVELAWTSSQYTEFSGCPYADPAGAPGSNNADFCAPASPGAPSDDAANHTQGSYAIWNLSTGYNSPDDRWALTAYVRNLSNENYKIFYNAPAVFVGAPRTYGVTVGTKW